jgi:hypothetical protein
VAVVGHEEEMGSRQEGGKAKACLTRLKDCVWLDLVTNEADQPIFSSEMVGAANTAEPSWNE